MPIDKQAVKWLIAELDAGRRPSMEEMKGVTKDAATLQRLRSIRSGYPTDDHWRAGARLGGNFQLIRRLGQGGEGEVWLADHLEKAAGSPPVVLKRALSTRAVGPAALSLTRVRERNIVSDLSAGMAIPEHPYVINYHGFEMWDDALIVVMDYANAGSVASHLEAEVQFRSWASLLRWATQSAWGVAFMHIHGLIHQDLKPSNILLHDIDGKLHARVSDFGLVQSPTAKSYAMHRLATALPRGMTAGYASPEQLRSETLTIRTDTYSWAKSWLHYAVGKPLDRAPQIADWSSKLGPPIDLRAAQSLIDLLNECLETDPMHRPNMGEVAYACRTLARHLAPEEDQPELPRKSSDSGGRRQRAEQEKDRFNERLNAEAVAGVVTGQSIRIPTDGDVDLKDFLARTNPEAIQVLGPKALMMLRSGNVDTVLRYIDLSHLHAMEMMSTPEDRLKAEAVACALLEFALIALEQGAMRHRSNLGVAEKAIKILNTVAKHGPLSPDCRVLLDQVLGYLCADMRLSRDYEVLQDRRAQLGTIRNYHNRFDALRGIVLDLLLPAESS